MILRNILARSTCFCSLTRSQPTTFTITKRWKVKEKWSAYRQPETSSGRALKYFDSYYASVFGSDRWSSMRLALLCKKSYCALVNRFSSDASGTVIDLIEAGSNLLPPEISAKRPFYAEPVTEGKEEADLAKTQEHEENDDATMSEGVSFDLPPKNQGLDSFMPSPPVVTPSDEKQIGENLLFVGSDSESEQQGFQVPTATWSTPVDQLLCPSSLQVFAFPSTEISRFPEPKSGTDGLLTYYLLDLASIFTVLALDPRSGERILDLCAAPGGKSLAIMQCCTPGKLVCVDKSASRSKRLQNTMSAYLPENVLEEIVEFYPACDAISFADNHCASNRCSSEASPGFDKVLVDAPCLNDRISVLDDENNWFKPSRNKERLGLPEIQRDILIAALRCCAVGGTVVYSTCTLAPGQNDGVVFSALQMAADRFDIQAVVEDPSPFTKFVTDRGLLNIDASWSRFGYLVAPILTANFGPSFCCRIRRTA